MARGQKYSDEIREKARALLAVNGNVAYVAEKLNVPRTTIDTWKHQFEDEAGDEFGELRRKNKEAFVNSAWGVINDALKVAQKRISRELDLEENVDLVAETIKKNAKAIEAESGVGWFELLGLIDKLKTLKNFKLGEISTLIGTMYDKQALANKEATEIIDGEVRFVKFEDL